jgi:hypothetical protein
MVVPLVALFVALAGMGTAARLLVTSAQITDGTIRPGTTAVSCSIPSRVFVFPASLAPKSTTIGGDAQEQARPRKHTAHGA